MVYVHQLECDRIEELSIVWKLPLLLLAAFLKQSSHTLLIGDDLLSEFRDRYTQSSSIPIAEKWEPSLPTIDEEEKPRTNVMEDNDDEDDEKEQENDLADLDIVTETQAYAAATMAFCQATLWSAIFDAFCSFTAPFLPIGLR